MSKSFTFIIEKDIESGKYIGTIPSIKGVHTYADTIDDLKNKLAEVLSLCLEEMPQEEKDCLPLFEGISQVEVKV